MEKCVLANTKRLSAYISRKTEPMLKEVKRGKVSCQKRRQRKNT